MLETIRVLIYVGGVLMLGYLLCLSLPQSKLREVLMPVIGFGLALFLGAYALSHVTNGTQAFLGPFRRLDDTQAVLLFMASAVIIFVIASARAELTAKRR